MKKEFLFLVFLLLSNVAYSQNFPVNSEKREPSLPDRQIVIDVKDTTFMGVLSHLCVFYNIPIGWERRADYYDELNRKMGFETGQIKWTPEHFFAKSGTLKEILDSLMKQDSRYRWEFRDGVINVFPAVDRNDLIVKLLDLKVAEFSPPENPDFYEIESAVLNIPEIKTFVAAENLELDRSGWNLDRKIAARDSKYSLKNTSLKTVLNHIIKLNENKMWIVDRWGAEGKRITISP